MEDTNKANSKESLNILLAKKLIEWTKPYYKSFAICILLLLFVSILEIINPIIIQKAIDNYIIPKKFTGLALILSLLVFSMIFEFIANYIQVVKLEITGQKIVAGIKEQAFSHVLNLDMSYFDKTKTGKIISRIENDANAMIFLFTSVITDFIGNAFLFIGIFCIMAINYNSKLALYVFIMFPIMIISTMFFDKYISPKLVKLRKYLAELSGYITEFIHGISIVQIFGQENNIFEKVKAKSLEKYKLDKHVSIAFNTYFNFLFFAENIGIIIVLLVGGRMLINGELTLGSLVLFISFIKKLFIPILQLCKQFREFEKSFAAGKRIFELLNKESNLKEKENYLLYEDGLKSIEFKNVWFRYSENSEWILKDVSFTCQNGEHWAIVGNTGSGKTTIVNLLLKFYIPQKGAILIDGVNIENISDFELREKIGLVSQDNIIFTGNIYDNLILGKENYSHKDVKETMKLLEMDSKIINMKDGYNTELIENAQNISSGEIQLINFARALIKNPSVFIFDEALNNVDPITEKKIQNTLSTSLEGKTALIISHRFTTIKDVDKILVLKHGKVSEIGTHTELLALGGFYSELSTLQVV